jgi:uncharacterized protein (DUF2062 family)
MHLNQQQKRNFRTLWHDALIPLVGLIGAVWLAALVTSWCLLLYL